MFLDLHVPSLVIGVLRTTHLPSALCSPPIPPPCSKKTSNLFIHPHSLNIPFRQLTVSCMICSFPRNSPCACFWGHIPHCTRRFLPSAPTVFHFLYLYQAFVLSHFLHLIAFIIYLLSFYFYHQNHPFSIIYLSVSPPYVV